MIYREADGGRAEQSLGLANAAGQRAVGVGEPGALRMLAGEQEPSADRVAEQVGVGGTGPGRDAGPASARQAARSQRHASPLRPSHRRSEPAPHHETPRSRLRTCPAAHPRRRPWRPSGAGSLPPARRRNSFRCIRARSTSSAATAVPPGRPTRPRCPHTASAAPVVPGQAAGLLTRRTPRSPAPWRRPGRASRAVLRSTPGAPRGSSRAGPRSRPPAGGLRRSRSRPFRAPGPRSRKARPPAARIRSSGSRPACGSTSRPDRQATRPTGPATPPGMSVPPPSNSSAAKSTLQRAQLSCLIHTEM